MKNVKLVFAALVMVVSVMACSPNEEDMMPDHKNQKIEKFNVKSDEEGNDLDTGGED